MKSARTWIFGLGALMLVVIVATWTLGISPVLDQVSAANQQTAQMQSKNDATQAQLASLKTQFADIGTLKTSLDTLRLSVPETEAASTFLNEISGLTAQDGVALQSVTLQDAVVYTAPAPASTATTPATTSTDSTAAATSTPAPTTTTTAPAATTTTGGLVLVPISVSVVGPLANVQQFISDLQQGQRLFVASTAALSIDTQTGGMVGTVTGNVFSLKGTSDVPVKTSTIPVPTVTPTATATATPTPTATKAAAKSGSSGGTTVTAPSTAPTDPSTPSPTPSS
jgi:Tfp pilus assembly protein PilO